MIKLAIIVPCYNEELVLPETHRQLSEVLEQTISRYQISPHSKIIYVNDGSKDTTWDFIQTLPPAKERVIGVNLAGNVGHQKALFAGLNVGRELHFDLMISIDADLQDDVQAIYEMVNEYQAGNDIVYGVRKSRESDSFFKRNSALLFYKLMSGLGVKTVFNHADFRLMSYRAVEELCRYPEQNLFLRGIIPLIGYKSSKVYYDRNPRFAGDSKYPVGKMLSFAIDGITSFSVRPLRIIFFLGIFFLVLSITACLYVFFSYFSGSVVPGWTSMILSLWFIGSCILTSIGVVGEYIGKIFLEVKARPRFNIKEIIQNEDPDQ